MEINKELLVPGLQVTIPGFVAMYSWGGLYWAERPSEGAIIICPYDVAFTVPEGYNVVAAEVQAIETELNRVADNYFSTVKALKERKESLLCIGHSTTIHDSEGNFDDVEY